MKNNDVKNFDFISSMKYCLIAVLVIILAGVAVWAFAGFNKDIDVTGGYVAQVKYDASVDNAYSKTVSDMVDIIEDEDFVVYSTQKMGANNDTYVVIKYQQGAVKTANLETANDNVQTKLETKFGEDNVSDIASLSPSYDSSSLLMLSIALIVSMLLIVIYMAIRYHFSMGIATVFGVALSMLMMLAITAICRIKVGGYYLSVISALGVMSLFAHTVAFTLLRGDSKKDIASNVGNINNSIVKSFEINCAFAMALLVVLFFVFNASYTAGGFALALIIDVFVSCAIPSFITLPLWKRLYRAKTELAKVDTKNEVTEK